MKKKNYNPFAAAIGSTPSVFAGKNNEMITKEILAALEDPNMPASTSLILGNVGIGKTTLLNYISDKCCEKGGWIVLNVSCSDKILDDIIEHASRTAKEFIKVKDSMRFSGGSVEASAGIPVPAAPQVKLKASFDSAPFRSSSWYTKITDILNELESHNLGLLILIDETIPCTPMEELLSHYKMLLNQQWSIAIVMAVLPIELDQFSSFRNLSFMSRAKKFYLSTFSDQETAEALQKTAMTANKHFTDDALSKAVDVIKGFPYLMQLVGHYSYEAAGKEEIINLESVNNGITKATKDFRQSILQREVKLLSSKEWDILLSMAQSNTPVKTSELKEQTHLPFNTLSLLIRRMIQKGVIKRTSVGVIDFALPGLREYLCDEYM